MSFVLPANTGISDIILSEIRGLQTRNRSGKISYVKKSFKPFQNSEFSDIYLNTIVKPYRKDIPNFYKRVEKLKNKMVMRIRDDKYLKEYNGEFDFCCSATFDNRTLEIIYFKPFFQESVFRQKAYIEHELTHALQSLLDKKEQFGRSRQTDIDMWQTKGYNYWQDPCEVECFSKDIYYEIKFKRKCGLLRTKHQVLDFIKNHEKFVGMNYGQKRKYLRVITNQLYVVDALHV